MLEASAVVTAIPSLWSAVNSWFTPAVLFLLLNLMIATIALTSSLTPTSPPSHDAHPYPDELQQQRGDGEDADAPSAATTDHSPSISILDRIKSLGLFSSPGKKSSSSSPPQQQRQPPPLIPPEELYSEADDSPKDPFERQEPGLPRSLPPVGKFKAFELYGYLHQEPASEILQESNPAHYIFEPTHPQEVLLSAKRDEKVEEEEGEEEDREVEEKEEEEVVGEEEEEETREGDGSEEETGTESKVPNLLLRQGIRRSESLNVKFSFSNAREEEGRGGGESGEVGVESAEKRRPATVREGKGKWGGDEEVDAKADDFINRFKQQLKLQRMDSMARQRDAMMISKARSF